MLVTATLTSAKLTVTAEASTPVAVANSSRQVCLRDEMPELCPSHFFLLLKGSHVVHTYVSVITSVSVEGGGGGRVALAQAARAAAWAAEAGRAAEAAA